MSTGLLFCSFCNATILLLSKTENSSQRISPECHNLSTKTFIWNPSSWHSRANPSTKILLPSCATHAASRAPFSRKAGSDSRRVSCNFPLCEMKRKHPPPPPPRPTPSSRRKEGNGERNGLIKRKEGEDYEEEWETRGEREDKSAIAGLLAKTGIIFKAKARIKLTSWGGSVCLFMAPLFFFSFNVLIFNVH